MKNKMKYIISIVLVVCLTVFFIKAPQWYYAFTDKNRQSDYGIQEVSLSLNEITAAQFFTLARSESATQIQVDNMDSSQVISGLTNSISNMKKYMEENGCTFAAPFLGYLQDFAKGLTPDNLYFFESVTGIVDNELLSTVVCRVGGKIQDNYADFIFDYNTNILYTINLILPPATIKYIDEDSWTAFKKALLSYWEIDEDNLWLEVGQYTDDSAYDSGMQEECYSLGFYLNPDITDKLSGGVTESKSISYK